MEKNYLRLKEVLSECGETGKGLAEKLGKSKMAVSHWVTNTKMPGIDTLHEIAAALGVDVCDLFAASRYPNLPSLLTVNPSTGVVFVAVEIGKTDSGVYLGGVWADLPTMCETMRGRGMKFPDIEAVASALAAEGVAAFDGTDGRRFAVFRDIVQGAI